MKEKKKIYEVKLNMMKQKKMKENVTRQNKIG